MLQSLWSLRDGFRFLKLVRSSARAPADDYAPPAALIVPCKGLDDDLRLNAERFLSLDYPCYQLIFVVASRRDLAFRFLTDLLASSSGSGRARGYQKASVVVAGEPEDNGEKVNNLLAGVAAAEVEAEVFAFADIDASVQPGWLDALVAPLRDPAVTVSTGYRWYLPGARFGSRLRAAWDTSIAMMFGNDRKNFAWGGSMAIRSSDFRKLGIAEHYWRQTVSDDYAITRAVRAAGGSIRFEPRCLVANRGETSFREFLRWSTRQIVITRVYAPHYWRAGFAFYTLYALTFLFGVVLFVAPGVPLSQRIAAALLLGSIMGLGTAKGVLRARAARALFPDDVELRGRKGGCYWRQAPLVAWVMLFNFAAAAFLRRIEWGNIVYELRSRDKLAIIG